MDKALTSRLMGIVDSHGLQGILARGKNRYKGSGTSPNPMGINSPRAAKLLLNQRKKQKDGSGFTL